MLASLGEIRSIKSWSSSRNSLSLELYVRHQLTEVHTVKGVVYLPQQAHLCAQRCAHVHSAAAFLLGVLPPVQSYRFTPSVHIYSACDHEAERPLPG